MPTDLHVALQHWYAGDTGEIEVEVDGYLADAVRDDVIYEIQTGSFTAIRDKLRRLARRHRVVLVYPIPRYRFIVKLDPETGEETSVRRSPKRGTPADVFDELLYIRNALRSKNLSLEVLMTVERELRCADGLGSWRRSGVSIVGRELLAIVGRHRFHEPADLLRLLPEELPERFTTADLRAVLGLTPRVAGKTAWGLRKLGVIRKVGKQGNAFVYRRARQRRPGAGRGRPG